MALIEFRYKLEKGSKKFHCPSCGKNRFVRYVDQEAGNRLPEDIGRCDRELNCGYHKKPNEADSLELDNILYNHYEPRKEPKASTLPKEYLKCSLGNYESNILIKWMADLPGWNMERAESVAKKYFVGTGSNNVKGWAIFWQVDDQKRVRSGKLMRYQKDGHRCKEGYSQDWVHSKLKRSNHLDEFELVQCFFGLHLKNEKPVALVESEKTALIASEYLKEFTWMATGQLNGINEYKMKALQGKRVVLFPDIGAFEKWNVKAKELDHIADFKVSDLLERNASDENDGYDLADYLIQFDLRSFQSGESGKSGTSTKHVFFNADAPHGFNPWTGEVFDSRGYPRSWDDINANK